MNDRWEDVTGGLLVRDGRIVDIGPHLDEAGVPAAKVIDAQQGYLLPGFI